MHQHRRLALLTSTFCLVSVLFASSVFAICGDTILDPGELCDDGNLVDGDGCDSNCTPTACGNGVTTAPELCDDGNLVDGDGCDANCTPTACGNGVTTAPELCDDGNLIDGDGCDGNCTPTGCGNGATVPPETCDDGNLIDGDGCDGNCTPTGCGNGVTTAPELCDDGNLVDGDGCDANCTPTACGNGVTTAPETCDDGNLINGDGCDANCTLTGCGNGTVTAPEACDDGNLVNGDGCDANCTPTGCGNGVTTAPETCDDGNLVDGDGCDANCTPTGCGNGVTTAPETCDDGNLVDGDGCDANCTPTGCGNGTVTAPEACDDGNLINGDGCDANCTATACGNGIVTSGEVCDDGNLVDADGCDSNCTVTACGNGVAAGSETCDDGNLVDGDACDSNCTITGCGNGIVTAGEICDDGNLVSGDGCDANCAITGCGNGTVTAPEACDDGNLVSGDGCDANCTVTACGNGILTAPEACDDGNVVPGDGCRANCTVEVCGDTITDAPLEACDDGNLVDGDGCDGNCSLTGCGNGITSGAEQCDDGNVVDGDGCSQQCQQEILNPLPSAGDHFGKTLASVAGNVAVGAPLYDAPGAINTGIVHLVHSTTGVVVRTFANPTPGPGDEFGSAIAAMGTNILVGAPFDDTAGPNAGAVYLFNGGTGALIRTFLNPAPGLNDHFGAALGVVGTSIVVGAPKDDGGVNGGGVAYVLHGGTGSVVHVLLNPQPAPDMRFATTVTTVGTDVVVGAPRFDRPAQGFTPAASDSGIVFVFDALSGALERTIQNPTPASGDLFGASLAPAGSNVLIGAPVIDTGTAQSGAAYLVSLANGLVLATYANPVPTVNDEFGYSVAALGIDKVVIGSRRDDTDTLVQNAGSAFVFHAGTGALLQTIQKGTPVTNDEFASSIATVGSRIFVGTPLDDTANFDAGAVYSFNDASCGNGTLDPGEGCDDGNLINGDTCDANCTATGCGNGVVTAPESCDDGNVAAGDGCSPTCTVEGACGDGIQEPFEGCDDGNVVNGDGCDANCTPTGCGNGVQTTGEQCDLGPLNGGGFCCAANCQAFDQDSDGVCDQDDVCPTIADAQANSDGDVFGDACDVCPGDVDNDSDSDGFCRGTLFNPPAVGGSDPCSRTGAAGTLQKPNAFMGRILAPLGDEKFRIRGTFLAGSNLPAMAPDRHGVQIRLADKSGTLLLDERIPGGAYTAATGRGWKVAAGRKWTYTDKSKPPIQNGLRQVVISVKNPQTPNPEVFVAVAGFGGTYPLIGADQFPIRVTVEVNDLALPPGGTPGRDQCGQVEFHLLPDRPGCNIIGSKIKCK